MSKLQRNEGRLGAHERWAENVLAEIVAELKRADAKHGPMLEKMEGYLTLRCEVAELAREVFRAGHDPAAMRREAIQVAAMAVKFLRDCCAGVDTAR